MTRRGPWIAAWVLLAAASAALLAASWGRWSHAIVDSGREWIVPDALSRGELLYRDVVYWFGPLTPYLHAALFRIFGSGFRTLALAGVLTAAAAIAALFFALRRVTSTREAFLWCAVAVPALVFMPKAGGAVIGMGFRIWQAAALTLIAVAVVVGKRPSIGTSLAAGALAGLAGLCRTEWGVAAVAACGLGLAVRTGWRGWLRPSLSLVVGWVAVFGAGILLFIRLAGTEAVLVDGHVLLTGLPPETHRFVKNLSGRDWPGGICRMLFSASLWTSVWLAASALMAWQRDREWILRRLPWLAGALTTAFLYRGYAGPWPMPLFCAAPLAGTAAALVGASRRGPKAAALTAFGSLALVLSYRAPFSITDMPYVAPPLLFAVVAAASLQRAAEAAAPAPVRLKLRRAAVLLLSALAVLIFVARGASYRRDPRVPIQGTFGLLRAEPGRASWMAEAAAAIQRDTGPEEALVVFPEGELLNFLADRHNPLRHRFYVPGYLTDQNEAVVLEELRRVRPGAIVVMNRLTGEYGRARFGEHYGRSIARWISQEYVPAPAAAVSAFEDRLLFRRDPESRAPGANPVR